MRKFEYKTVKVPLQKAGLRNPQYNEDAMEKLFNQLGNEGWELVSGLHRTAVAAEDHTIFIFKREK